MNIQKFFFLLLLVCGSMKIKAQAINCNSFCVTNISLDTAGTNTLSLIISMGGSGSDFIDYPYVSTVTNSVGDTIASGGMQFFGQFGGTSQTYTVSTTADSLGTNFTCTVYFTYDSVVCALPYPCIPQGITEETILNETLIYPNPSSGKFIVKNEQLYSKEYVLTIFNSFGEKIYGEVHSKQSKINEIDLSAFPKGVYFVQFTFGKNICRKKIIFD